MSRDAPSKRRITATALQSQNYKSNLLKTMFVFVLNKDGKPLMPTKRCGKVRRLLKSKQAKVVCAEPFTIQLLYDSKEYVQEFHIGIDTGSKHTGISVSTEKEEVFSATVELRQDIKDLLKERNSYRRSRRCRLRARKQKDKKGAWEKTENKVFSPSADNKMEEHIRIVKYLCKILPLEEHTVSCVLEIGKFDTHLLKDPTVNGVGYQNGECKGFENKKAFVRYRDNYECQYCHGKTGDTRLEVHHIKPKNENGTDDLRNLITLCSVCHDDYHDDKITLDVKEEELDDRNAESLRHAAMMNAMRYEIYERFKKAFPNWNIYKTAGHITAENRRKYNIEKSHANDAYVIAGNFEAKKTNVSYTGKFFRAHNRKLYKANILKGGKKKKNYSLHLIKGFTKYDRVVFDGKRGIITSMMSTGYATVKTLITGERIHEKSVVSVKRLVFLEHGHTLIFELNR